MKDMFEGYLKFVGFIGNESVPISILRHCAGGFYQKDIDNYIKYGIIEKDGVDEWHEEKYKLTYLGKKLYRHEITIKEVISLLEN